MTGAISLPFGLWDVSPCVNFACVHQLQVKKCTDIKLKLSAFYDRVQGGYVSDEFCQQMYTIAQQLKQGEAQQATATHQALAASSSMDEVSLSFALGLWPRVALALALGLLPRVALSLALGLWPRVAHRTSGAGCAHIVPCPSLQSGAALMAIKSLIHCVKTQKKTVGWVP